MSSIGGNPQQPKRERSPDVPLAPAVLQQIPAVAGAGASNTSPVVTVANTVTTASEESQGNRPADSVQESNLISRVTTATVVAPAVPGVPTVQTHLPFTMATSQTQPIAVTPSQAAQGPTVIQQNVGSLLHTVPTPTVAAVAAAAPSPAAVAGATSGTAMFVSSNPVCLGDAAAVAASVVAGGDGARSLRVEDALSYLDVVKNRFSNRPNVYAEFLDVMRDFKSQSIDTSTVVNRVNELFESHNDLIQAFNQFLPANQRASPSASIGPGGHLSHPSVIPTSLTQHTQAAQHQPQLPPTIVPGGLMSLSLASADVCGPRALASNSTLQSNFGSSTRLTSSGTVPSSGLLRGGVGNLGIMNIGGSHPQNVGSSGGDAGNRNQPEFSQAITYVNKIKTRFSHQPDKYKQFLEILQKYQQQGQGNALLGGVAVPGPVNNAAGSGGNVNTSTGQPGMSGSAPRRLGQQGEGGTGERPPGDRPFSDLQVYKQVSRLFEGQSDLLHEFKTFLPEVNQAMLSGEMLCNAAGGMRDLSALSCSPALASQASAVSGPQALGSGVASQLLAAGAGMRRSGGGLGTGEAGLGVKSGPLPSPNAIPSGIERLRTASMSSASGSTPGAGAGATAGTPSANSGQSGGAGSGGGTNLKRSSQLVSGSGASGAGSGAGAGGAGSGAAGGQGSTPQAGGVGTGGVGGSGGGGSSVVGAGVTGGGSGGTGVTGGGAIGGSGGSKRSRMMQDLSFTDAPRHASLEDYDIFDKAENELNNDETIKDFYRIIHLYNENILRPVEVIHTLISLFGQNSDVVNYMKRAMNYSNVIKDSSPSSFSISAMGNSQGNAGSRSSGANAMGLGSNNGDRLTGSSDYRNEVDINTCLNFQQSYRQLPATYKQPKCSGRDDLCREVLNDKYISCASWLSEDTSVVSSKKNMFEEYLYQVEDQRYELDMVIDLNYNMMQILNAHLREIENMPHEQAERYTLDENLGCPSGILMRKALQRLYGEKTRDIITGLRRNPQMAIPLVLRRLQAKDEEWRTARTGFNDTWRDAQERYHLKSLDYQGPTFKQNDFKVWRVKTLLSQIRAAHEEWKQRGQRRTESQYVMKYPRDCPFHDAASLIIHHVKRQQPLSKEDKGRIKVLVRRTLPLLFNQETTPLSDDEEDDMDEPNLEDEGNESGIHVKPEPGESEGPLGESTPRKESDVEEKYSLLFGNNFWYVFLRLHHLLCERLVALRSRGQEIVIEKEDEKKNERADSTAEALRLRKPCPIPPEKYYEHGLEMVKALLEGNLDNQSFEDQLRELFSIHAYIWFTMDKLMMTLTRQLQHIVTDERTLELTRLWRLQRSLDSRETGAGGSRATRAERIDKEERYRRRAVRVINPDNEDSCYRLEVGWPTGEMRIDIIDPSLPKLRVKPKAANEGRERGAPFPFSSLSELRESDKQADNWCKFLEALDRKGELVAGSILEDYMKKPRFCNRPFKTSNVRRSIMDAVPQRLTSSDERMEVDSPDEDEEVEEAEEDDEEELTSGPSSKRRRRDDMMVDSEFDRRLRDKHGSRIREYGARVLADIFEAKIDTNQLLPNLELHYVHDNPYVPIYQLGGAVLECLWHRNAFSRARKAHNSRRQPDSKASKRYERLKAQWRETHISPENETDCENWFLGRDQLDFRDDIITVAKCADSMDDGEVKPRRWEVKLLQPNPSQAPSVSVPVSVTPPASAGSTSCELTVVPPTSTPPTASTTSTASADSDPSSKISCND